MTQKQALPHWDLSNVYPGLESEAFSRAVDDLKTQLNDLDAYLNAHHVARPAAGAAPPATGARLTEIVEGHLDRLNAIRRLYRTLYHYAYGHVATDSYSAQAKRALSAIEKLGARRRQLEVRFRGWLGGLADALPQILQHPGRAQEHAFYLQEVVEQSQYLMSEPEEVLAQELMLSGAAAWQKLQGTVCSQLTVEWERDGQVERLPITALQNLRRYEPDEATRRRAYEVEIAAWERVKEPLAAALNGVKGTVVTLDQRRGRVDALHDPLDQSRIGRQTLETMLGVIEDHYPLFRRYLKAKAQRLDKETLSWWDLFAPVGQFERRFSFAQAQTFILEQFATFNPRLADFARHAFERRWIDAEPRDGKRGGAFCISLPAVQESRILCNFDGTLDQVSTVAHELGHAYHNHCKRDRTRLNQITPMTLAETASIFCESIITDAALKQAASPQEELAILETALIKSTQTLVDIPSRFLFEKEVFERREASELSADDFCDIMLRAQAATYGEGLDPDHRHPYMWAWKPHYYLPKLSFYNYPYAFGLLFGTGLYAIYQDEGEAFLDRYDDLLASTGQAKAADLAARFGIDIRRPGFWQDSLQLVAGRIERYLEL